MTPDKHDGAGESSGAQSDEDQLRELVMERGRKAAQGKPYSPLQLPERRL